MADEHVIAYKQTATDEAGVVELVQYVATDKARYAKKLLLEDGYNVEEEPLTELPDGVELDITDEIPDNAADYLD